MAWSYKTQLYFIIGCSAILIIGITIVVWGLLTKWKFISPAKPGPPPAPPAPPSPPSLPSYPTTASGNLNWWTCSSDKKNYPIKSFDALNSNEQGIIMNYLNTTDPKKIGCAEGCSDFSTNPSACAKGDWNNIWPADPKRDQACAAFKPEGGPGVQCLHSGKCSKGKCTCAACTQKDSCYTGPSCEFETCAYPDPLSQTGKRLAFKTGTFPTGEAACGSGRSSCCISKKTDSCDKTCSSLRMNFTGRCSKDGNSCECSPLALEKVGSPGVLGKGCPPGLSGVSIFLIVLACLALVAFIVLIVKKKPRNLNLYGTKKYKDESSTLDQKYHL